MLFNKDAALKLMQVSMAPADKARTGDQNVAMVGALDDLSMRLRSMGFLTSYEETVASGSRSHTAKGSNEDIRSIFAVKIGSGTEQVVLDYIPPKEFIAKYDSPETTAAMPTVFTIESSTDGFPNLKFDCPLASDETIKIWYFRGIVPENVALSKSLAAVAVGSLAYFYGTQSAVGQPYYQQFQMLAKLSRDTDDYMAKMTTEIPLNRADHEIRLEINALHSERGA